MSTSLKFLRLYLHRPGGHRQAIGYLSAYGDILRVSFDETYINDPSRPVLSLSYIGADEAGTRAILSARSDARTSRNDGRWPVFFQNLLPEGHNRERLARQRQCQEEDEFELLAAAGHDLMGAVEVEPIAADEKLPDVVKHWHVALGLDVLEPGFVEFPVEDGYSLGGVVTKFSAVHDGRRYVVQRKGAAGSFILKLPSTRHPDLVEVEAKGYELCKALGLDCAEHRVISRDEAELPEKIPFEHILAVKRFDRTDGGQRIHMEEFAQVLGLTPKNKYGSNLQDDYAQVLRVLNRFSTRGARDCQEFVNRFVAFVLLGNTDAHLKNWALLYPDGQSPVLAPLYDPVSVSSFFAAADPKDYGLNRAIDRKLTDFGWGDLQALLTRAAIPRAGSIVQKAKRLAQSAQAKWPALLVDAPPAMRTEVLRRLNGGVRLSQP